MEYTWARFFTLNILQNFSQQMQRPGVRQRKYDTSLSDHIPSIADIASQFRLMFQNTIQNATAPNNTGLMYHGYDFSHKASWASADRGHSPEVWDRALGWYSMALVDILDIIPKSDPGYASILSILRTILPHVRDAADPTTGVWWLVITQPGRQKNYFESSGSAMFTYAMLKAVRMGYLSDTDGRYVAAAQKAHQYMVNNWVIPNPDMTMGWTNTVVVRELGFVLIAPQRLNVTSRWEA